MLEDISNFTSFSSVQSLSRIQLLAIPWIIKVNKYCIMSIFLDKRTMSQKYISISIILYIRKAHKTCKLSNWNNLLFLLLYDSYLLWFLTSELVLLTAAAAAAKSLQSCPTLCDPVDGSPPGFPVPGILQARTLEWVAISFSNAWKWKGKVKSLSHVRLLATPGTVAHQAPLSLGFSRQEY